MTIQQAHEPIGYSAFVDQIVDKLDKFDSSSCFQGVTNGQPHTAYRSPLDTQTGSV